MAGAGSNDGAEGRHAGAGLASQLAAPLLAGMCWCGGPAGRRQHAPAPPTARARITPRCLLQVCELKAKHALEMDAVQTRLSAVLGKKDGVIARLRVEVAAGLARLAATEQLLRQQGEELRVEMDAGGSALLAS